MKNMKEIKAQEKAAKNLIEESDFKGYTIEEIRFQRALVAMEAEFCKEKCLKSWDNIQSVNPLSPKSDSKLPVQVGNVAKRMLNGLNYMDYIMLGFSLFGGARKVFSLFRRKKK